MAGFVLSASSIVLGVAASEAMNEAESQTYPFTASCAAPGSEPVIDEIIPGNETSTGHVTVKCTGGDRISISSADVPINGETMSSQEDVPQRSINLSAVAPINPFATEKGLSVDTYNGDTFAIVSPAKNQSVTGATTLASEDIS